MTEPFEECNDKEMLLWVIQFISYASANPTLWPTQKSIILAIEQQLHCWAEDNR